MKNAHDQPAVVKLHMQHEIVTSGSFSVVGVARLELATTCSQSRYANQLRYTPDKGVSVGVGVGG